VHKVFQPLKKGFVPFSYGSSFPMASVAWTTFECYNVIFGNFFAVSKHVLVTFIIWKGATRAYFFVPLIKEICLSLEYHGEELFIRGNICVKNVVFGQQ